MRISLPAGRALWHEVPPGRLQIDGHFIPARYHVGVGIYALHHSDKLYGQPFDFIHERGLRDESGEGAVARARSAFNPFSLGPRGCIGEAFGVAGNHADDGHCDSEV